MVLNQGRKVRELSHEEFISLINKLAKKINKKDFNNLYGLPRGGQVVAVYLSHKLDLPIIEKDAITDKTLIIDDIADSGNTLESFITFRNHLNKYLFNLEIATLFCRVNECKFKSNIKFR